MYDYRAVCENLIGFATELADADRESFDLVLARYSTFKREIAGQFRAIAETRLLSGVVLIDEVCDRILAALTTLTARGVPAKYAVRQRRGKTASVLLQYLASRIGDPVPASRLRILTGDQVHTERRVRELRELGLNITWARGGGEEQYVLADLRIDLAHAVASQLREMIREDDDLNDTERRRLSSKIPDWVSILDGATVQVRSPASSDGNLGSTSTGS